MLARCDNWRRVCFASGARQAQIDTKNGKRNRDGIARWIDISAKQMRVENRAPAATDENSTVVPDFDKIRARHEREKSEVGLKVNEATIDNTERCKADGTKTV